MPTFDVVSEIEKHELDNALDQARREITQRFDFKNTQTEIEKQDNSIVLRANSEGRVEAAWDVVASKLAKRGVALLAFEPGKIEPAGGQTYRQKVDIKEGVTKELGKEIVKEVKDSKIKVQASIQGDAVRISGKKRDDLQQIIALLKQKEFERPLQFNNFRD